MKHLKKSLSVFALSVMVISGALAQETSAWTEADRKYLLDNLTRSRDELVNETRNLSKAQWSFKESPDRWSINEIVEHIAIWELLLCNRISNLLDTEPQPALVSEAVPDSTKLRFIMEEKVHHSTDYTKPYTYTIPMGLNELKSNVAWFSKMRNESIVYITGTHADLRAHFFTGDNSNPHGTFITLFGHTDRHLRQIRKVKKHPDYPKK